MPSKKTFGSNFSSLKHQLLPQLSSKQWTQTHRDITSNITPLMAFTKRTAVHELAGHRVHMALVAELGLYVVAVDAPTLGPNWTRVTYGPNTRVYTTKTVLGADESTVAPICRYLAQQLIDGRPTTPVVGVATAGGDAPQDTVADDIVLTFSLSLKGLDANDANVVRQLAQHLLTL